MLDLSENKIYDIMKQAGTSKKMINNLLSGRFTPVNYSKPRFETKVRTVKDQMNKLNQEDGKYIYTTNRNFLFPQSKLDSIIDKYSGVKFFPEIYNEETQKLEGGYNPDNESYQTDKEGRLMYDDNGKPLKEEGFIKRNIKKIPGAIKDLVIPGSPGFTSKPEAPPLGNTPTPKVMKTAANINPTTNLTQTESALLSPEEQIIRQRLRT